jgi:anti-sigma B factor antagonist
MTPEVPVSAAPAGIAHAMHRRRRPVMKLSQEIVDGDIYKMSLHGALDIAGSAQVDPQFQMAVAKQRKLIVDIAEVDFLASIGIRTLVKSAKGLAEKGGRMAVYGAQEAPKRVLESTGVDRIIMLVEDEDAARAYVNK